MERKLVGAYKQTPTLSRASFLAALLTVFLWATAYVGIRTTVRFFAPETLALLRFLTASVSLVIYAVVVKMKIPDRRDVPLIFCNGFIGFFLYNLFLNMGSRTLTAGVTSFLISTAPIFTVIFSLVFLKERINIWGWLGILIGFLGIGVITFAEKSGGSMNLGVLWVFLAAILISLYNITVKRLLSRYKPVEATTYCIWAGTLCLMTFLPDLLKQFTTAPAFANIVAMYLGVFPAAIGYILWSYALSKTEKAGYVACFMYLTPLMTTAIGWLSIKEMPQAISIVGGLIVLGGMVLTNLKGK